MPNLEYELALQADRNNTESEERARFEYYRAQEIESELELAQTRIAVLEAVIKQTAKAILNYHASDIKEHINDDEYLYDTMGSELSGAFIACRDILKPIAKGEKE